MALTDLQKQLGLGLAVKSANQPAGNQDYSYRTQNPDGSTGLAVSIAPQEEQTIDLGGGSYTSPSGGGGEVASQVAPIQSFASNFSASSPASSTVGGVEKMSDVSGVPNKKKKNIAETAVQTGTIPPIGGVPTAPVSPTLNINQQQRLDNIAKRQGLSGVPQAPTAPIAPSPTGLQGAELQAYNMLTPQEQKTFQALATQGLKAQTDYLAKSKASMEFAKSQEAKRTEMEDNQDAIADMNSQRNIEEATKQVANLKQNIGYLGTGGQPGVSSQKLDAVSNQVTLADRTLKNILESERLSARNRELGQEKNSEIFTRQIKILQDDLDSKVNKTVQSALNEFTSAELAGKLDTIPEIEAFQQQLYAQLDGDLSSIMDTNIEARKFLIERYDKLAESQKSAMQAKEKAEAEALKRKNTLNKEMSQALGYYVNENGEAITDRVTGQNIVVPPESDVTYDKDSGQMVILTKNRDGSIGVQIKQVGTAKAKTPEWKQDASGNWYDAKSPVNPTIQGAMGSVTGDLRYLADQFPNQAWAKNNNPAGITWNANFDRGTGTAGLLQQAGIKYEKGTARPANEGGNYVTFPTIEDGLAAQRIMMTQTYGNSTVGNMLSSWVGTSEGPNYAKQVASMAGIQDINTPVNQLSPEQLQSLQMAKIQKESPGLAKLLSQGTGTQNTDQRAEVMALVQGLGGTESERAGYAKNIMDRANKKGITPIEAKKELGYKTLDDKNFEEARNTQYKDMYKSYNESTGNAKTALQLLEQPQNAIGDVASVVGFLKTIDPQSVARESEVTAVENARGVIDGFMNIAAKATEGTKLTPDQRTQIKQAIQTIVTAQDNKFKENVYNLSKEFEERGLDASVYIPNTRIKEAKKEYGKAEEAKKKLGGFSLSDILNNLD